MTTRSQTRTICHTPPRRFDWIAALILLTAGAGGICHVVNTIPPIAGSVEVGLPDSVYAQRFFTSPNVGGVALLLLALLIAT
ncbi:MAG: hypothetical protein ACRETX_16520, partial [Steroidobacteraceae bacterium]